MDEHTLTVTAAPLPGGHIFRVGEQLNDAYEIRGCLGQGGMSQVFEAQGLNVQLAAPEIMDGWGLTWNDWWQSVQGGHGKPVSSLATAASPSRRRGRIRKCRRCGRKRRPWRCCVIPRWRWSTPSAVTAASTIW